MRTEVKEEEGEYDPHLHREVEKPTTNWETLIHLLKACLGTGILAMPQAYRYSGMINGIVSTIAISILCTYCVHTLVKAQYVLCKRMKVGLLKYPESMKAGLEVGPDCMKPLAKIAPVVTNIFLIFNQLGICCVYVVFVAVSIKEVVEFYEAPFELKEEFYIAFLFVPFLLIMTLRNLKILAPFSFVANIITLLTYGVVAYYVSGGLKDFRKLDYVGSLFDYPLFVGTALFSLQSIAVIITLENNMKTPENFGGTFGVLNIGVVIITLIYVIMSMLGYWRYGDEIEDSITLNFPEDEILAHVIQILYSLAIYISFGLQGYVSVNILWTDYVTKCVKTKLLLWEYILRFSCVVIIFLLAATVPLLGFILSLVGVISLSALSIAFPAILDICTHWPDELGPLKWILIKDIFIIILGIVGLISGAYSNIYSIIVTLYERGQKEHEKE